MLTVGIAAEYNPFHNGHAYLISKTREYLSAKTGDDVAVVSVMSGNFVQRGDFAIMNKFARAESALRENSPDSEGSDLIIELPLPYACASAEFFASGVIKLLDATGIVSFLAFGSECGQTEPLYNAARYILHEDFHKRLSIRLKNGEGYAAARQAMIEDAMPDLAGLMNEPNNILGIEYIKSILREHSSIRPLTIKRQGARHDGEKTTDEFASASYIRGLINSGSDEAFLYLPGRCAGVITREIASGRAPVSIKNCERAMLAHYRKMDKTHFVRLPDATEGLDNRIMKNAKNALSFDEIITKSGTKRYPDSRIRRMLLFSYLGIDREALRYPPSYVRVLAANETGIKLLKEMKKKCRFPIITKAAHSKRLDKAARELFEMSARATDIYVLAYPDLEQAKSGIELIKNIKILEEK